MGTGTGRSMAISAGIIQAGVPEGVERPLSTGVEPLSVLLGVATVSIVVALLLEARLKPRRAWGLPYVWGYFQGSSGLIAGSLAFVAGLAGAEYGINSTVLTLILAGAIWAPAGYYVIRRRRWAWIVHTAASLNPVWWIANYLYARRRWSELEGRPHPKMPESHQASREPSGKPKMYRVGIRSRIRRWHAGKLWMLWGIAAILLFTIYDSVAYVDRSQALLTWLVLCVPLILITWIWFGGREK